MMKDICTLPSHLTDKDVSSFHFFHERFSLELNVRTFHLSHELGQSLLQLESRYPCVVPTFLWSDNLKYTKMQI